MIRSSHRALRLVVLTLVGLAALAGLAWGESPFGVTATPESKDGAPAVRVRFRVPEGHFLYAEYLRVSAEGGATVHPLDVPEPAKVFDKFSEEDKHVYSSDFESLYRIDGAGSSVKLVVELQGCDDSVCFFPEKRTFELAFSGGDAAGSPDEAPGEIAAVSGAGANAWRELADRFEVTASATGYLRTEPFIEFLDGGLAGAAQEDALASWFRRWGVLAVVFFVLVGGAGLNLTPCVLPLIPINLAIIGAGAKAGSKGRGFAMGAAYGLGMAFVYGALGLIAVLTGSKFGALNASPWFNLGIAIVFVVLSLAMFDLITIDLTRFQGRAGSSGRGHFLAACGMGAVAALLAGACVAPVVISVLLLSGTLYAQGHAIALALPFLLGVGMGLPWPFAGAGLSFLPKPGKWMTWVKYGFGVLIIGFAIYYGHLAYSLFRTRAEQTDLSAGAEPGGATAAATAGANENDKLATLLRQALDEDKPVFIDFWATWCKNCLAMERTTFKEAPVAEKFGSFVVIKYQAEMPNDPATSEVLDYFGAVGLPTYVVLLPKR